MYQQLSADLISGRVSAENVEVWLTSLANGGGKGVEARKLLAASLERRQEVCGALRSNVVASAKAMHASALKALVSLLLVLSCGPRPAFGATNDALWTPGGIGIALSGHKSASSPPTGVTTTIHENVFQDALKGMDTNCLNASRNGKLLAPGPQSVPTNSQSPIVRTTLEPVDLAVDTRINQLPRSFSVQDKYGGILYKAYRADNPLQLINPFAPREYGQSEAAEIPRGPITGAPRGWSVFSIQFK